MQCRVESSLNLGGGEAVTGIRELMGRCWLLRFSSRGNFWLEERLDGGYLRCHWTGIEGCDAITKYEEKGNRVFALSVKEGQIDNANIHLDRLISRLHLALVSRANVEGVTMISQQHS